ncbi:MAG TPA: DUF6173 family protein [Beijerinckiaceae bacterium]|nr:DUF6173 family protein [Beijerinckiaceae bacterium]
MTGEPAPRTDFSQADWMFERIIKSLQAFEAALAADEEIGVRLAAFSDEVLSIESVGYWNPDLIKFTGVTGNGERYELVQHVSQVSLLMAARPKRGGEARRIGFILGEQLEKARDKQAVNATAVV